MAFSSKAPSLRVGRVASQRRRDPLRRQPVLVAAGRQIQHEDRAHRQPTGRLPDHLVSVSSDPVELGNGLTLAFTQARADDASHSRRGTASPSRPRQPARPWRKSGPSP